MFYLIFLFKAIVKSKCFLYLFYFVKIFVNKKESLMVFKLFNENIIMKKHYNLKRKTTVSFISDVIGKYTRKRYLTLKFVYYVL